ncbi:MAG TPA: hypothetical protein VFV27_05100 [Nevskiaceae bacterium]|nr:hypothetical protein [Nevskiaceae bacterium]
MKNMVRGGPYGLVLLVGLVASPEALAAPEVLAVTADLTSRQIRVEGSAFSGTAPSSLLIAGTPLTITGASDTHLDATLPESSQPVLIASI